MPGHYDNLRCEECMQQFGPHNFDKNDTQNMKRQSSRLICKACKEILRCAVCQKGYEHDEWSRTERANHRASAHNTALVCRSCRDEGFHAKDISKYKCHSCKRDYGCKKFDKLSVKNFKVRTYMKLVCVQCTDEKDARIRELKNRMQRSKRRWTCRCPVHKEKCPLTPVVFGEKRWPGSDGAISAEDNNFLDSLDPTPTWWNKAWGR